MPLIHLPLAAWLDAIGPLVLVLFWVIKQIFAAKEGEEEAAKANLLKEQRREADAKRRLSPEQKKQKQSVDDFLQQIGVVPDEPKQANVQMANLQMADPQMAEAFADVPVKQIRIGKDNRTQSRPKKKGDRPKNKSHSKASSPSRPIRERTARAFPDNQLAEHASHLGEQISSANARVEERLHQKFDHNVGNLAHVELAGEQPYGMKQAENEQAARILELLASPSGIQDAVVLSEILNRPADRW